MDEFFSINLHAHTKNSDGADSIQEMAKKAKELGHSALVITDHDTSYSSSYLSGVRELTVLVDNNLIDFPVIIGSEIMTPFGEYLLFGKKACSNWQFFKNKLDMIESSFDHTLWVEIFKNRVLSTSTYSSRCGITQANIHEVKSYGLVLCHPRFNSNYVEAVPESWWSIVHGFEVVNGLEEFEITRPQTIQALRQVMPWAIELKNSDAHSAQELTTRWNDINKNIKEENDLIQWLQSGKKKWKNKVFLERFDT